MNNYMKQYTRRPIRGNRPDLIAFTKYRQIFPIEAKGSSKRYVADILLRAKFQAISSQIRDTITSDVAVSPL